MIDETKKDYVVFTTIINRKDVLHDPHTVDPRADYICFTDEPEFLSSKVYRMVKMKKIEDRKEALRNMKKHKMVPHQFAELHRYPFSVFHDGNMQVKGSLVPLIRMLDKADIGFFSNSLSKNLTGEADINLNMVNKNDPNILNSSDEIQNQVSRYLKEGYPNDLVMMAGGLIVRNQSKQISCVNDFNRLWWYETENGIIRDQIPLNYALWKSKIKYKNFGDTVWGDPYKQYFIYWRHNY